MLSFLLEHGANPDPKMPNSSYSPLRTAVGKGHLQIARLLLEFNAKSNHHFRIPEWEATQRPTALALAAKSGHLEIMDLLIDRGARAGEGIEGKRYSAITSAAKAGQESAVARLLLMYDSRDIGTLKYANEAVKDEHDGIKSMIEERIWQLVEESRGAVVAGQ
ncbi:hypothetical protein BCR34DRAFT_198941 [Clohesyomyces aquaticus]|uniref:Uncharacterized protein n=1 Tax=Clohesyomyces aquaticus TaxID=1231657 RepID=A0A1Y1ZXU7_9PLEO|nr:hypothetical protein BCR34DRAFT_198941 [Clohesyomyces aquaticus]